MHAIAIDNARRLYVADRGNSRIAVFDENGTHLDTWPNIRDPWHVHVAADQSIWVADGATNKFLKFDKNGKLLHSWGTFGQEPGQIWACTSSRSIRRGTSTRPRRSTGASRSSSRRPAPTARK